MRKDLADNWADGCLRQTAVSHRTCPHCNHPCFLSARYETHSLDQEGECVQQWRCPFCLQEWLLHWEGLELDPLGTVRLAGIHDGWPE
jgi:hypothetical protein